MRFKIDENKYAALLGETVTAYDLSKDRRTLTLTMASGKAFKLETEGDCCSETWIEQIDGEAALFGTIVAVDDIEMPDLGNVATEHHGTVDVVDYYGLRITTEKGWTVLDYRNDSNGYYGGWLNVSQVTA